MNNLNKTTAGFPSSTPLLVEQNANIIISSDEDTFQKRMMNALKGVQKAYDVTFIVGFKETEIGAHSIILKIQSPKFREIFDNNEDVCNIIKEKDVNPEVFRIFLQYLYTGVLANNIKYVVPILHLSVKYSIPDLQKAICNNWFETGTNLWFGNAVRMYEKSEKYKLDEFKAKCMDFICKKADKILDSFLIFTHQNLCTVIACDRLSISNETQVFKAVLKWGKHQCLKNGKESTEENLRNELNDLIPLIRFPLMSKSDFLCEVVPTKILNDKEILSVLSYYNNKESSRNQIFCATERRYKEELLHKDAICKEEDTFKSRMMDALFEEVGQNLCDVTFYVGRENVEIRAHKTILKIQSPKFREVFERNQKVLHADVNPAEFRMFLQFLYTGVLTDDDRLYALPLLQLAVKYDVPDLCKICVLWLEKGLDWKSVVQVYEKACKCNQLELKQKCLDLIFQNGSKILISNEFYNFTNDNFCSIIASDDLQANDEAEVFEAVLKWGKKQCVENGMKPSGAKIRNELKDLIPLIRFPLMKQEYFSHRVVPSKILTENEITSVLLYYNSDAAHSERDNFSPGIFSAVHRKKMGYPPFITTLIEFLLIFLISNIITYFLCFIFGLNK